MRSISVWQMLGLVAGMWMVFQVSAEPYPFGRVFTSAEERRLLDQMRGQQEMDIAQMTKAEVSTDKKPARLTVSGVLIRADGQHMVWVDGKSQLSQGENIDAAKAKISRKHSAHVVVKNHQQSKVLKPGQVWLLNEGKVKEVYELRTKPAEAQSITEDIKTSITENEKMDDIVSSLQKIQSLSEAHE